MGIDGFGDRVLCELSISESFGDADDGVLELCGEGSGDFDDFGNGVACCGGDVSGCRDRPGFGVAEIAIQPRFCCCWLVS
jgi:hypothetical protein